MKKHKQKKINNIWFWLTIFLAFITITFIVISVTNDHFKQLWSFWGWYLVLAIIIGLLTSSIVLFARKYRKIDNHQKMNKLESKKTKFK